MADSHEENDSVDVEALQKELSRLATEQFKALEDAALSG
jgi:hypothetical protein